MRVLIALVCLAGIAACTPALLSPDEAARVCEREARAAQAPTGSVSIGANSGGEISTGIAIGVTSDFLAGRDPLQVYEDCVFRRSGEAPIRPPVLRS